MLKYLTFFIRNPFGKFSSLGTGHLLWRRWERKDTGDRANIFHGQCSGRPLMFTGNSVAQENISMALPKIFMRFALIHRKNGWLFLWATPITLKYLGGATYYSFCPPIPIVNDWSLTDIKVITPLELSLLINRQMFFIFTCEIIGNLYISILSLIHPLQVHS